MKADVELHVERFCGDRPCDQGQESDSQALLVRHVFLNGYEVPFTKVVLEGDGNPGILMLKLEICPSRLETLTINP